MKMQAIIAAIFPPQCITCGDLVVSDFGLCPKCWRDTPFISGLVCHTCGLPLPGDGSEAAAELRCDDCLAQPRNWAAGRAVMLYKDNGRRLVLALKHGDRMDLARPAGPWLARAARGILRPDMLVVPVPLFHLRLIKRRYNQAVLLGAALARQAGLEHCPDALIRHRPTAYQEGLDRLARFENVKGAFRPHPKRGGRMAGRPVLLIDDVMTSGATFSAASEAAFAAGAAEVVTLALARVAKDC